MALNMVLSSSNSSERGRKPIMQLWFPGAESWLLGSRVGKQLGFSSLPLHPQLQLFRGLGVHDPHSNITSFQHTSELHEVKPEGVKVRLEGLQ